MRVEMNSANAALRAPGWYTSWWLPTAILLIGILTVTRSSLSRTTEEEGGGGDCARRGEGRGCTRCGGEEEETPWRWYIYTGAGGGGAGRALGHREWPVSPPAPIRWEREGQFF
jgi:hypothetical protein